MKNKLFTFPNARVFVILSQNKMVRGVLMEEYKNTYLVQKRKRHNSTCVEDTDCMFIKKVKDLDLLFPSNKELTELVDKLEKKNKNKKLAIILDNESNVLDHYEY